MNFLEGEVAAIGQLSVTVQYGSDESQTVVVLRGDAKVGDKVTVGIRPEHLHVAASGNGAVANVMAVESMGDADSNAGIVNV